MIIKFNMRVVKERREKYVWVGFVNILIFILFCFSDDYFLFLNFINICNGNSEVVNFLLYINYIVFCLDNLS